MDDNPINYFNQLRYSKKLSKSPLLIAVFGILMFLVLASLLPNYFLKYQKNLAQAEIANLPNPPSSPQITLPPIPENLTSTPVPPTNTPVPPTPTLTIDVIKPTVNITSPLNGSTVQRRININVAANASDNTAVMKVEFRRNGSLICSDTTVPYSCSMYTDSGSKKTVVYEAKAYDTAGNNAINNINVKTN